MTFSWNKIATLALLALATAVSTTNAQIEYLDPADITQLWSQFATDGIDKGNGVFLSPSGDLAVVVSRNGAVSAFNPATGVPVWSFPTPSATSNSTSGAFFVSGASPYIAYCVKTGGSR